MAFLPRSIGYTGVFWLSFFSLNDSFIGSFNLIYYIFCYSHAWPEKIFYSFLRYIFYRIYMGFLDYLSYQYIPS